MLLKPEVEILFSQTNTGGLGLISVSHKSKACLIRNFLEMSANPDFLHSQFSLMLYRAFVLQEPVANVVKPPYYNEDFFNVINCARNSGLPIETMKVRQWYKFLMELENNESDDSSLFKVQVSSPDVNWSNVWLNIRHGSLDSETASFGFKLVHGLLATEEKTAKVLQNTSPSCKFKCPGSPVSDLAHIFFLCQHSADIGAWLLALISSAIDDISPESVLNLDIEANEPMLWVILQTLKFIWDKRSLSKPVNTQECLATLHDKANILLETKHMNLAFEIIQLL